MEKSANKLLKKSMSSKILIFALKKKFINGINKDIENNSTTKSNTIKNEKIKNFFLSYLLKLLKIIFKLFIV